MGNTTPSRENDRSSRPDNAAPQRVRVQWRDDPTRLEQEAEFIDRLFGEAIAKLFEDTS